MKAPRTIPCPGPATGLCGMMIAWLLLMLGSSSSVTRPVHLRRHQGDHRRLQSSWSTISGAATTTTSSSIIDVSLSENSANTDITYYRDYQERDWQNTQVDTGGPFLGPSVLIESSNNNNYESSSLIWDEEQAADRIIGGYDAEPHPFHSMLLLRYGGGWRWAGCAGTLISNCHVLTAAHCTADPSKPLGAVFVNAHRPYQENLGLPFHFSAVHHVTSHAAFNETTNEHDMAIIKLTDCLNSTDEFPPAIPADPTWNISTTLLADILGFGKLSEEGNMFTNVESLQIAQVPIIPNQTCMQYYGDRIKQDMFCGGFADGGVDACQGDSGSSMTFETNNGSTVLLGVVSWGLGCGRSDSPGVYSSVQYHYHWIAEQVCSDPDTNVTWCSTYSPIVTPSPSTAPPSPSSVSPVGNSLSEAPQPAPTPDSSSTGSGKDGSDTVWK